MFLLWKYLGRLLHEMYDRCERAVEYVWWLEYYNLREGKISSPQKDENGHLLIPNLQCIRIYGFEQCWDPNNTGPHWILKNTHTLRRLWVLGGWDALITSKHYIICWYICVLRRFTGRENHWQCVCKNFCYSRLLAVIKWTEQSVMLNLKTHFMKSLHCSAWFDWKSFAFLLWHLNASAHKVCTLYTCLLGVFWFSQVCENCTDCKKDGCG